MFETRRVYKTYEQISRHIRDAISTGDLQPGDRLPTETELATQFGVSRPTMREALKVLEALNVLSSSTGPSGGTFVRKMNSSDMVEQLGEFMALLLDIDGVKLQELCEARESIEVKASRLAAQRRSEEDLRTMSDIIERDNLNETNSSIFDISFHRAIAEASKNRILSVFMSSIHVTVLSIAERSILPEVKQISQEQHRGIYEAIRLRDEDLAEERMMEHMRFASEFYQNAISEA